jgi:hypothetical protein
VPDRRHHRGPHPRDQELFGNEAVPRLRRGVFELSWLLSRGYPCESSLLLVGNHHQLSERQRTAVLRCSCSDQALAGRLARQVDPSECAGRPMLLDGYNVLTTLEAALAGGFLIQGRDGCLRDMASMHGTWHGVDETLPALEIAARTIAGLGPSRCVWYLDRPVSNSGRLARRIQEVGSTLPAAWDVELVPDPDPLLARSDGVVVSADSAILDRCRSWLNLASLAVATEVPEARLLDLAQVESAP